ncbi:MAG: hypothetical protein CBD74_11950 [Saprospirales bacterium TMED214]|nr:MAG: hypothetical protein CBD74_11950 [Saprospirales bacterium TMED214]
MTSRSPHPSGLRFGLNRKTGSIGRRLIHERFIRTANRVPEARLAVAFHALIDSDQQQLAQLVKPENTSNSTRPHEIAQTYRLQ